MNCILCQRNLEVAELEWEKICISSRLSDEKRIVFPPRSLRFFTWSKLAWRTRIVSRVFAVTFVDRVEILWSKQRIEHDLESCWLTFRLSNISAHHRDSFLHHPTLSAGSPMVSLSFWHWMYYIEAGSLYIPSTRARVLAQLHGRGIKHDEPCSFLITWIHNVGDSPSETAAFVAYRNACPFIKISE